MTSACGVKSVDPFDRDAGQGGEGPPRDVLDRLDGEVHEGLSVLLVHRWAKGGTALFTAKEHLLSFQDYARSLGGRSRFKDENRKPGPGRGSEGAPRSPPVSRIRMKIGPGKSDLAPGGRLPVQGSG